MVMTSSVDLSILETVLPPVFVTQTYLSSTAMPSGDEKLPDIGVVELSVLFILTIEFALGRVTHTKSWSTAMPKGFEPKVMLATAVFVALSILETVLPAVVTQTESLSTAMPYGYEFT